MLKVSNTVTIPEDEIKFHYIRAQGAGGQHVNKTSSAVQLFFDVKASPTLPDFYKERLLALSDKRITKEGVVIIKSQNHRSQDLNRTDALERLLELIKEATKVQRRRIATKPTYGSKKRRTEAKNKHSKQKQLRKKISY